MTVLELIQRTTEFLKKKHVDSPRLQAELLLAYVLQVPRMHLYLNFESMLTAPQLDQYRELVRRRGLREPLQHILGSVSFCGLEIAVSRDVLVPRPETELLAECGWQFLNQSAQQVSQAPTVLDYGTGSGCLAITLAVKCRSSQIHAVDISQPALDLARRNAATHGVSERVQFWRGDGAAALPAGLQFDLVVSNPPYIPTAQIDLLQPEVRDYDPRGALDGGPDGLVYYRRLPTETAPLLRPEGRVMVELGDDEAEAVRAIFKQQNWIVERVVDDYTQRPRIMIATKQPGQSASGV